MARLETVSSLDAIFVLFLNRKSCLTAPFLSTDLFEYATICALRNYRYSPERILTISYVRFFFRFQTLILLSRVGVVQLRHENSVPNRPPESQSPAPTSGQDEDKNGDKKSENGKWLGWLSKITRSNTHVAKLPDDKDPSVSVPKFSGFLFLFDYN